MSTRNRRAFGVVAGLALASTLITAGPASAAAGVKITLPALSGRYPVGTTDLHLVDQARKDPWHPAQQREVMATVTYPAQPGGTGPRAAWMRPGVADAVDELASGPYYLDLPRGTVDWSSTHRRARAEVAVDRSRGAWPVVLFSPGYSSTREINSTLTDDLAARGYVVVSMSHTYESTGVEFPDGRVARGVATEGDPATMKTAIDARIADTRFVLDQLERLGRGVDPDAEHHPLPRGLAGALDLSRIGMAGHSYGGYTAAETMYLDRRIDAGADLDGAMGHLGGADMPENAINHGLDRPFLLLGANSFDADGNKTEHSHATSGNDPSWAAFWSKQRAWKRDLHLDGGTHYSLTDLQAVVPQLGSLLPPARALQIAGRIDPARSIATQRDYLAAYFDLQLKGHDRHLFDGDSPCHPDARFIP